MICLQNELRWGATLGDGRYRGVPTIAFVSGYSESHVEQQLVLMERAGLVKSKRGWGRSHGNRKVYAKA